MAGKFKIPHLLKSYGESIFKRNLWFKKKIDFGKYEIVTPGRVSPRNVVPDFVPKPNYYISGVPAPSPRHAEVKSEEQIEKMRASGRLAAQILRHVGDNIKIGQTTDEIDRVVHRLTIEAGAYPSPLNYKGFPKSVCTSVNNVACHGIPDDRVLRDGDIINVDVTVYLNGFHGDCSKTFLIGDVDDKGADLVRATEVCLQAGIAACGPGQYFTSIGDAIDSTAAELGYGVIPVFAGHGIGHYFHGPPDIFHCSNDYPGIMREGMTFTIEPVLSQGSCEIDIHDDGWTTTTTDDSRTAQFEHTVLIIGDSAEVLTA